MSEPALTDLLLVEDSAPMARVYGQYLRAEPYRVRATDSGAAALDMLRREEFRIMMLDISLPDISSLAVSMMTGISAVAGLVLSRPSTSRPSMPGIIQSSRIRPGRCAAASSRPCLPFSASNTR